MMLRGSSKAKGDIIEVLQSLNVVSRRSHTLYQLYRENLSFLATRLQIPL